MRVTAVELIEMQVLNWSAYATGIDACAPYLCKQNVSSPVFFNYVHVVLDYSFCILHSLLRDINCCMF